MVLTSVNMPLEGIALIAGIDRSLDMMRTSINIVGDASAAVVVGVLKKLKRFLCKQLSKSIAWNWNLK